MEHDLTANPKTFKHCTLLGTMKSDNVIDYSNVMWPTAVYKELCV